MNPEMKPAEAIVIVGGGHAAAQLCAGLAAAGQGARVHLVCDEAELPYQRPPLSKAFMKSPQRAACRRCAPRRGLPKPASRCIAPTLRWRWIAPRRSRARCSSGAELPYARARARHRHARTHACRSFARGLANVAALRSAADAVRLRALLEAAQHLTVLGGGFIGLEIAATARALGKAVTVLESAPRLLARSVSPELAEHVLADASRQRHRLAPGRHRGRLRRRRRAAGRTGGDGVREPVELLVLGIGAAPQTGLASAAGLQCDNGIVVDACMRTSDPAILAIGDCANFPQHSSAGPTGSACGSSRCRTRTTRRAPRWPRCSARRAVCGAALVLVGARAACGCRWPA